MAEQFPKQLVTDGVNRAPKSRLGEDSVFRPARPPSHRCGGEVMHACHANFCNTPCRPEHLMCSHHWAMVSGATKTAVCSHYRRGQCQDMRPSREWFDAANRAVAEVAQLEGKPMSGRQRQLVTEGEENGGVP